MKFVWFKLDGWLWLTQSGLAILGLVIIGSVAPSLFWPQLVFVIVGGAIGWLVARLDYRIFMRVTPFLYLLCILLLFLPLVLGFESRGSTRWLRLGWFNLQPSEIIKPFFVLFFAGFLAQEEQLSLKRLAMSVGLMLLPVWLIFNQPDLGSSLVILFLWLGMILAAGVAKWWLAVGGSVLALISPILWHFLKDYQKERITSFLNPQSDPLGAGYHVIQAKMAVGSGQFWGRGLGRGTQSHLRFLPERQTDFIFASLAEELGFWGSSGLLALFGLLMVRVLRIAQKSRDRMGELIGAGVFSWLFAQMAINVGINLGFLPVTGITLPLVSYGGSSILAVMMGVGLVQSVALRSRREKTIEIQ